jgi:hypothetical protein
MPPVFFPSAHTPTGDKIAGVTPHPDYTEGK